MTSPRTVPDFVPVCSVGDVVGSAGWHTRPTAGVLRQKAISIFREDDHYYAINFICPHLGGPLGAGVIKDGVIECPWHGWRFHADSGLSAGEHGHEIAVYECKIEDGQVWVGDIKPPVRKQ